MLLTGCGPSPKDLSREPPFTELPPDSTVLSTAEQEQNPLGGGPGFQMTVASPLTRREVITFFVRTHDFEPTEHLSLTRRFGVPFRDGELNYQLDLSEWPDMSGGLVGPEESSPPPGTQTLFVLTAAYVS
jgi:hypothetical protein